MKFSKSESFSGEYCARIVNIQTFEPHPNPEANRLKCALVGGYSVSVPISMEPGLYIYIPMGCQLNKEFLGANNEFRKEQLNADPTKHGYFEEDGRVKPCRLKGYRSEGILYDFNALMAWYEYKGKYTEFPEVEEGLEFDLVDGITFVKRYVVPCRNMTCFTPKGRDGSNKFNKIVEGQFRFHYDTESLLKAPWVIKPWNLIHISTKFHGTSGISSYILCRQKHTVWNQLGNWLTRHIIDPIFGTITEPLKDTLDYDYVYASRKVIKNKENTAKVTEGYYGNDAFRAYAHDVIKPHLAKGMTVYYEIVGFTSNGRPIQSIKGNPMDYGCVIPNCVDPYTYGKNFDVRIYRVTYTNPDGCVYEFSAHEVQLWCKQHGLHPVRELYWGFAKDLYPDLDYHADDWAIKFCHKLQEDAGRFYMEQDSPDCVNSVPHEGIVIKIDDGKSAAYKLKSFRFLSKEDEDYGKGISNIEDEELSE